MKIKPLTGNVLVELDVPERVLGSGIFVGQHTPSAEENQVAARSPVKPPGEIGTVREIGAWPKARNGLSRMPEFFVGSRVVLAQGSGIQMRRFNDRFRLVYQHEVLAVIEKRV